MSEQKKVIGLLVLGMHRSGTSALTGMLDQLGIPAAGELLPAENYNEKGIFENKAVNLFHNRLLAHLGSSWDDPIPVSNHFVESAAGQGFVRELAGIVESELLSGTSTFAVKDPRMCRFIPLWKMALRELGTEPQAIVPLRHPLDVAGSLASRDGFPRAKSFLLWLDHTLSAERETRDLPRSFIAYDRLLSDWRGVSDKIAADLDLTWPKERGRVEDAIDSFLTQDLRHHASAAEIGTATRLDSLVAQSWDALCALIADQADDSAHRTLDAVRKELTDATAVVAPYVAWEFSALASARREVDRLNLLGKALRRDWAQLEADLRNEIQKAHDARVSEREQLQQAAAAERQKAAAAAAAAVAAEQQKAAAERRSFHQTIEQNERDLADLRQTAELAGRLEQRVGELEADSHHLRHEVHQHLLSLNAIKASTSWKLTAPLRSAAGSLAPSAKVSLRRIAKAGWWAVTPWRMPARIQFLRERKRQALLAPASADAFPTSAHSVPANPVGPVRRGASFQPAMGVFEVEGGNPRLSMVTDSINAGSLFGGVATALIFTALLAKRTGRRLRIVTRTQAPAAENVATVFRAHGIEWTDNIEFAFADINDDKSRIDVHQDELFVTTSWWTTHSTRQSIADEQILYILQEDERMFYPFGDEYLTCSETIGDSRIQRVINSQLLHQHLKEAGIIGDETPFFEPSFPKRIYFPEPAPEGEKRNFFFYARPNNVRNLYSRGVEVIERAIERGVLDPKEWRIHFVGKDLAPMRLSGGVAPILLQNMPWEDYAAYVRSVDLALTLMYTPHPSYPPLDVAACGGVAVTNSFGVKTDLSRYSRSIVCTESDVDSLVEGLRLGIAQALDQKGRMEALSEAGIKRDWQESFEPVFDKLVAGGVLVR